MNHLDKKTIDNTVTAIWIASVILMVVLFLLTSCTTTKYIEVPTVKIDTVYKSKTVTDSVYVHDSTIVKVGGDTVFVEKWHTRWRDRIMYDTLYQYKIDSIPKPYPVEKVVEVEKELSWWQDFRLWFANIALVVLAIASGIWMWRKLR